MITVGSRDGRKGLGLGFGVGGVSGEAMEETELEEGEACSYHDEDEPFDPDISLSYIGDKIQNVLGHFRKDFEGGVSAENLGAKFGGYGSFLPTYQRSPAGPHPRTPQKAHNQNTFASPRTQPEGGHHSSVAFTNPHSVRHMAAVTNILTVTSTTTPSTCDSIEKVACKTQVEPLKPRSTVIRSETPAFQKPLKVRIKVGSGNLLTQTNVDIYNGLGLYDSQSASEEDSPAESDGLTHAPQGVANESPNTILQAMTTFPVNDGRLLSPLPDDLMRLAKQKMLLHDDMRGYEHRGGRGRSTILANGYESERTEQKVSRQNKMKLGEKSIKTLTQSVREDLKTKSVDRLEVHQNQNGNKQVGKSYDSVKRDSNAIKGVEAIKHEATNPLTLNTDKKITSPEKKSMTQSVGKDHTSSIRKKKSKGSKNNGPLAAGISKVPLVSKVKKGTRAENNFLKSESEQFRRGKTSRKDRDIYRDLFGDTSSEHKMNETISFEKSLKNSSITSNCELKENIPVKKIEKRSTVEAYSKDASYNTPLNGNGPVSDAAPSTMAPTDSNDNWVCCDKCQKWRLLPFDLNPEILPENWMCSMLNWLGEMNRCSISEDETNKPVNARNLASQSQNQNNPQIHDGIVSGVSSADVRFPDQNHRHHSLHAEPSEAKKKQETKEILDTINQKELLRFSGFMKKTQPSAKGKTLYDVSQSPVENEPDFQQLPISSGSAVEKRRSKKNDNNKLLEHNSIEDVTNSSKVSIKRKNDEVSFEGSKKTKKEGKQYIDDVWMPEEDVPTRKTGPSSSNGFAVDMAREYELSLKNLKRDGNGNLKLSITNLRNKGQVPLEDRSMVLKQLGNLDTTAKMRKVKECDDNLENTSKDQRVSQYERALSPRNFASMGAISSSSIVSGSHNTKAYLQEVKSSPVDSVSSSPLKNSNTDRFAMGRTDIVEKDDRPTMARKDKSTRHGSHESSVLDFEDRDFNHVSDIKPEVKSVAAVEGAHAQVLNANADISGQHSYKPHSSGSSSRKLGKESSSRSKDKIRSSKSKSKYDDKHKRNGSSNASEGRTLSNKKETKDNKSKAQEKRGVDIVKVEETNYYMSDREVKLSGESSKKDNPKSESHGGRDAKISKHNLPPDHDGVKSSKSSVSDKSKIDRAEIASGRGMSVPPLPSVPGQDDSHTRFQKKALVTSKENGTSSLSAGASDGVGALREQKQIRKAEKENGGSQVNLRHATPNVEKVGTVDAPSLVKRDPSAQAAILLKEAKDLKHVADHLKNSGSNNENIAIYFEAAMKFLQGASLLESINGENSKPGDQSMLIYSSTTKLCEFCAHEYERSKDMAGAALAYKCTEVAYMRVIYSSQSGASRDRHELQTALQMAPPGESPSSSASDLDNLNNAATMDKVAMAKGIGSPQVIGNHAISARNRPSLLRILNYTQEVNSAMEASRKSRICFGAASISLEGNGHEDTISSIKRALDFNFHDVQGLLRLVRLAMEAMGR